jgi:hypothetical protein
MDHFAGLDVSTKGTSVCIVDDTGRIESRRCNAWEARTKTGKSGADALR